MNVLFVASEAAPLVKIGGLADVVGGLPKALRQLGHDVRVMIPLYGQVSRAGLATTVVMSDQRLAFAGHDYHTNLLSTTLPGSDIPLYLVQADDFFGTDGVYVSGQTTEALRRGIQRFVAFSAMAVSMLRGLDWQPEVVHCHDWHTGLVPLLLSHGGHPARTVLTIHNLHNQGAWNADELRSWFGWQDQEHPLLSLRDEHHDLNLLQIGIHSATVVSTVSPTYAQEVLTAEYGEHLSSDLAQHQPPIVGIANGIDVEVFDPSRDPALVSSYSFTTHEAGKRANKAALQQELGLQPLPGAPLFVAVSRLSPQKGFDLLPPVIGDIVQAGGQVAILGSGWPEIEGQLHRLADDFPRSVVVRLGFDAGLAQRLYASADFFLMPSRFEPCGLGQMIAMRYGTIPIVRDTGGLRDTVVDQRRDPTRGTGFVFPRFDVADFRDAIRDAVQVYRQPATLNAMIARAMSQDFSWGRAAHDYLRLYAQTETRPN